MITYYSSEFISLVFSKTSQKMPLQAAINCNYVQLNWNVELTVKIYREIKI